MYPFLTPSRKVYSKMPSLSIPSSGGRLFKFGQCEKIAIIPKAVFSELLLLAIIGLYAKLTVQEGWVTSKCLTEICSVSEFLHGRRRAVLQQQHFALPCMPAALARMWLVITAAWSCPRWEAKTDRELPTRKDVPGRTASLASSLSPMICV